MKWRDPFSGKWRWTSCRSRGATNDVLREALRQELAAEEGDRASEVRAIGGRPRWGTPITTLIDQYLEEVEDRGRAREGRADRAGLAAETLIDYRFILREFRAFVGVRTTGDLDGELVRRFKHQLATGDRAPATTNKYLRSLRAFLNRFGDANPPYFRQPPEVLFRKALAAVPAGRIMPVILEAVDIRRFLAAALAHDREHRPHEVDLFPHVALHVLTGARTHEILGLRWADVDLAAGTVTFRSRKTGRERRVPLAGDRSGDVSPGLLRLLEAWRPPARSPRLEGHILAHRRSPTPALPRKGWDALRHAEVAAAKPKAFRSTWTSYLVSMGRQPALVAWWAGHSPLVLERHYADYVRGRLAGETLDEAMGIADLLEEAARA